MPTFHRKTWSLAVLAALVASMQVSHAQVQVEETTTTIPTYLVGNPEKDPYFFTGRTYQGAAGHVYPYPIYDILTDERVERDYKYLTLSNEYTTIGVLPEIGGRIFEAMDNQTGYHFFYRQHVIRPALIGMIGSWISGGVEWNVPHHHRASSTLNAGYEITEDEDGGKTIWIGETELRQRMKWDIGLTMYPGKSYVKATFRLQNRTPLMQSFLYWANVSVHANEDYQVQFPPETVYGTTHSKTRYMDWPMAPIEGRPEVVDESWWAAYEGSNSTFAVNYTQNHLVGYDFGADAGTAYYANRHLSQGKKFFLWGTGSVWNKMLTEEDGAYLELMTGSFSDNQPDYSWIGPNELRQVEQWWYPIKGIGGAKMVTLEGACNVERKSETSMFVGFNATSARPGARVLVMAGDKVLMDERIDIDPNAPFATQVSVPSGMKDEEFCASLYSAEGEELVSYRPVAKAEVERPHEADRPLSDPKEYGSVEELLLAGQRLEEFHNARLSPLPYWEEALRRDSLDSRTNVNLGIHHARRGEWAEAEKHLQRAYKRLTGLHYMPELDKTGIMYQTNPKDGEMFYYLGVASQALGKEAAAEDCFWKSTWYPGFQSASFLYLAEMYWRQGKKAEALESIDNSLANGGRSVVARFVKAWILSHDGKEAEAVELLRDNVAKDPLDFLSRAELVRLGAGESYDEIFAHMGIPLQETIEVATFYGALGAYKEAADLLEYAKAHGSAHSSTPMQKEAVEPFAASPLLDYMAGYYRGLSGDDDAALAHYKAAAAMSPDYCFPFRDEERAMLEDVLERNPSDAKAPYYLGNLLYYREAKDAAMEAWKKSVGIDPSYGMAWRNLGFAADKHLGDQGLAAEYYAKAIEADSSDPKFFTEYDIIREGLGVPSKDRLALLKKNLRTVSGSDDAMSRYVHLLLENGEYDAALSVLDTRHFRVWEGGSTVYTQFVDAHLLRGLGLLSKGRGEAALSDFLTAGTFPENLETNELSTGPTVAKVSYHQGLAYKALGQDDEAAACFEKCIDAAGGGDEWMRRGGAGAEAQYYMAMAQKAMGRDADSKATLSELRRSLEGGDGSVDIYSKFGEEGSSKTIEARMKYGRGLLALAEGNPSAAKEAFSLSLEADPSNVWAKHFLGQTK